MTDCRVPVGSRRRLFWATQPDVCGTYEACGHDCGKPGLQFTDQREDLCGSTTGCPPANVDPACPEQYVGPRQRSIVTEDWLRGLVINMLMTDAKQPDTKCGYRPGTQGGHWSESYIEEGPATIGTLMRTVEPNGRIQDSVNLIKAYISATLDRLVQRGVALSVDVEAKYVGGARMEVGITIVGVRDGEAKVGMTAARLTNGWVWE